MSKAYNPSDMKHYNVTWDSGIVTKFAHSKNVSPSFGEEFIKKMLSSRHAPDNKLGKPVKVKRTK